MKLGNNVINNNELSQKYALERLIHQLLTRYYCWIFFNKYEYL